MTLPLGRVVVQNRKNNGSVAKVEESGLDHPKWVRGWLEMVWVQGIDGSRLMDDKFDQPRELGLRG
jgi:hypothetical protein